MLIRCKVFFLFLLMVWHLPAAASDLQEEYISQGETLSIEKGCTKSIRWYRKAIRVDPKSRQAAKAYYEIGFCRAMEEDDEGAIESYTKSLQITPAVRPYFSRGKAYFDLGQYERAAADFKQAFALKPDVDEPRAFQYLGSSLLIEEKYQEAIYWLNIGIERNPKDARLLVERAEALFKSENYVDARKDIALAMVLEEGTEAHNILLDFLKLIDDTAQKAALYKVEKPRIADKGKGEKTFKKPEVKGYALDLCLHWGRGCGKPAADAWCHSKGFKEAKRWKVEHDTPPTIVMGNGKTCEAGYCDRISSVTCRGRPVKTAAKRVVISKRPGIKPKETQRVPPLEKQKTLMQQPSNIPVIRDESPASLKQHQRMADSLKRVLADYPLAIMATNKALNFDKRTATFEQLLKDIDTAIVGWEKMRGDTLKLDAVVKRVRRERAGSFGSWGLGFVRNAYAARGVDQDLPAYGAAGSVDTAVDVVGQINNHMKGEVNNPVALLQQARREAQAHSMRVSSMQLQANEATYQDAMGDMWALGQNVLTGIKDGSQVVVAVGTTIITCGASAPVGWVGGTTMAFNNASAAIALMRNGLRYGLGDEEAAVMIEETVEKGVSTVGGVLSIVNATVDENEVDMLMWIGERTVNMVVSSFGHGTVELSLEEQIELRMRQDSAYVPELDPETMARMLEKYGRKPQPVVQSAPSVKMIGKSSGVDEYGGPSSCSQTGYGTGVFTVNFDTGDVEGGFTWKRDLGVCTTSECVERGGMTKLAYASYSCPIQQEISFNGKVDSTGRITATTTTSKVKSGIYSTRKNDPRCNAFNASGDTHGAGILKGKLSSQNRYIKGTLDLWPKPWLHANTKKCEFILRRGDVMSK
ncbi:MAG: tetratricopeptide repeat protein [Candidatus Sedimenticola sp. (ex Thyasira tokunagai)]